MIAYHYSVVRCRDGQVSGEPRNVGLLLISPTARKAWLRRSALKARAHLVGDDATFVQAVLDAMEETAGEVAREGDPARVHDWLRSRARPTEDALWLAPPAVGIASDLSAELSRLGEVYLGKPPRPQKNAAEKLQLQALRTLGIHRRFGPRVFAGGPATWKFPCVGDTPDGRPLIFNAIQFGQKKPESIIESAWVNVGRAREVARDHRAAHWLTVAIGPESGAAGRAFGRAVEVMQDGDLNVIGATADAIASGLARLGLGGDARVAEAK